MKIKIIFLATFFLSLMSVTKAQPPCGTNPLAGDYCSTATPICNLNGYCGNTSSTYTATVSATNSADEDNTPLGTVFCGSIENNSWLSFVAGATSATFDLWPSNCSDGYGIQMEVYSTTDCYNFTSVSNCYNPGTVTNGSVTATGLVAGQTYYIMIDGNAGDICDYIIGASSGVAMNPTITGNQTICPSQNATIDITNGGTGYSWTANPADASLAGQTTQSTIIVHPTQTTTYTCNVAGSNPNPNCPGSATLTCTVTVLSASDPLCSSNPGCNVVANASATSICPGQGVTLSSSGAVGTVLLSNTFDNGTVGVGWAATSTATFTNPCPPSPPYGTTYLWMGASATAPRNLTSLDFNVSNGGTISFWMRYSVQGNASPCEGPDEIDEGFSLQYSTNGGGAWSDIAYFRPNGTIAASNSWLGQSTADATGATPYTVWNRQSFTIPAAAQTVSSRFRWIQLASTAATNDHWGLDSIMIMTPPPTQNMTWTSVPAGLNYVGLNPPVQYPTVNTCYIATMSDGTNSCDDTICVTINTITANAGPDATICPSSNTQLSASGGTIYAWSPATNLSATNIFNPIANPATTTTYTVTVTSAAGCSNTDAVTVNVSNSLSTTMSINNSTCGYSNGSATCTVNGGQQPITFVWSTAPVQSLATATGLPAGTYSVTATDAGGCSASNSVTINNIAGPTAQINTFTDENCGRGNGSATVLPNGGTAPITYLWNSNPQQTGITANNLPGGTYIVTITDINTCTATATVTIANIPGPTLSVSNTINETCTYGNGSILVNAINGLPPYSYTWNSTPAQYSANLTNVPAGNYTVTVTDGNSCSATTSAIITNTPAPTLIISNVMPENCGFSDGSAIAIPNGGLPPYSYLWNTAPQQATANATGLPGGTYTVTVTDANSCTATAITTISIVNGPTAHATGTPEYCDRSDGALMATGTGGSGVYTYIWSTQPTQYTQNVNNVPSGTYTVTVDDGGCSSAASVTIMNIPGPIAGFTVHPTVQTILDGPVSFLDHSSGNILSWNWNLGDGSSQSLTEFEHNYEGMGIFVITLIVTDDNACKDTAIDTLKIKDIFTVYIPTAFTPNGDSYNEYFFPQGINIDPNDYEMTIFDRWGNLMYATTALDGKWNGTQNNSGSYKEVIMDVYVYRIKLKEIDGPKHEYVGRVSLIP